MNWGIGCEWGGWGTGEGGVAKGTWSRIEAHGLYAAFCSAVSPLMPCWKTLHGASTALFTPATQQQAGVSVLLLRSGPPA